MLGYLYNTPPKSLFETNAVIESNDVEMNRRVIVYALLLFLNENLS